jgi:hypothetical protein
MRSLVLLPVLTALMTAASFPCSAQDPAPATTQPAPASPLAGEWEMETDFNGQAIPATMIVSVDERGSLRGIWRTQGRDIEMRNVVLKDDRLTFEREGPGGDVKFVGRVRGDRVEGEWDTSMGAFTCRGQRTMLAPPATAPASQPEAEVIPNKHDRPILERDGRTLLWAKEKQDGDTEWFDMTDAMIDPRRFQFGIGKDTIASVDEPVFVRYDDPRLAAAGITPDTPVLGVAIGGTARAYPVNLMSMHEIVNDEIAGKPYAVMW